MESDGLKAIVTRRVAVWENSKVGRVVLVWWLWAGLRVVDRLECYVVDRVKGLWISKGKTRVLALYPKNYPPKNVCSSPRKCYIPYQFLPFLNKKMEAVFR